MQAKKTGLFGLTLGSVGVVYGDIGTSPLYAFRESLAAATGHNGLPQTEMVLGVLSLVLWAMILIVSLKYVTLLLRADNGGEGGILSLMALAKNSYPGPVPVIMFLGMLGAALFYGDAIITPAISVLSAVEGLKLVTEKFTPFVIPIALIIIVLLFLMQRQGTKKVARYFGPIMVVWFLALAWGGLLHVADSPEVWSAINPAYALYFMTHHGIASLIALGAVFLAVTGAEALYADLGHFGKKPIRLAWVWFVMPSLMLNYFGQAALVIANPEAAHNSFFLLYPDWALIPMVILATMATVIASQAVITGAFSLTHQAIALGLLPRLHIKFTSKDQVGQIYMSQVNWLLMLGVILLILMFHSSTNLANAYGIAVTGTMMVTTLLAYVVMRRVWRWNMALALACVAPLFLIETVFLSANLLKLFEGGIAPIALSLVLVVMMATWMRGSETLHKAARDHQHSMDNLITQIKHYPPTRVGGTAIYLTSNPHYAPSALLQNLKHNKVLHEQNLMLTLEFVMTPSVAEEDRVRITPLCDDFTRMTLRFGYMESPNVTRALMHLRERGIAADLMNISFFISRRNIVPSPKFGMKLWRDRIYIMMANNASDAADYFHIPQSRVVELGVQVTV